AGCREIAGAHGGSHLFGGWKPQPGAPEQGDAGEGALHGRALAQRAHDEERERIDEERIDPIGRLKRAASLLGSGWLARQIEEKPQSMPHRAGMRLKPRRSSRGPALPAPKIGMRL